MKRSVDFVAFLLCFTIGFDEQLSVAAFSNVFAGNERPQAVKPIRSSFRTPFQLARPSFLLQSSRNVCLRETANGFVKAENVMGIQALFNTYCDSDGLMSKEAVEKIPIFQEMLSEGDILPEEFNSIWSSAQKFPGSDSGDSRIDRDGFVQIYRDVDDLFEDEDIESESSSEDLDPKSVTDSAEKQEDAELEAIFESICDSSRLLSRDSLKAWDEIQKLLGDGLLGEDEFEDIWNKTPKNEGSNEQLDKGGFLSFNIALDSLFEFEDEDDQDPLIRKAADPKVVEDTKQQRQVVEGDDLPPGVLFAAIANEDYLVGLEEMKSWGSLQEMLADGDLLQEELQSIFERVEKAPGTKDMLTEAGFIKFFEEIESLFEDEDDLVEDETLEAIGNEPSVSEIKEDLLSLLMEITEDAEEIDGLRCGLDSSELEQKQVLSIVAELEKQPTNLITSKNGNIDLTDLAGTWELLYSSSSAMKFNQGLSGLGGSFPNGKFGGLKQKLVASKYLTDVEYTEHIEVNPEAASFDVTVTGSWDLRTSVSLFTGAPSIVLNVEPEMVTYGPTSTRGDHWKSLGPLNMLDLSYIDEDIRVMRGCTSSDTLFIFQRTSD